jgi:hypothetical protein
MPLGLLWGWGIYKTGYNNISMLPAICELGVPTEQQTSFSKFCFENSVENFKMLKRAFGDTFGTPQIQKLRDLIEDADRLGHPVRRLLVTDF